MNPSETSSPDLSGQTVLVTRSADQAGSICQLLEKKGAATVVHPVIEILPLADFSQLDNTLSRIDKFDWIVFVSVNGVQHFIDRMIEKRISLKVLERRNVASIGSATSDHLKKFVNIDKIVSPSQATSFALAHILATEALGQRALLVRASRGSREISERLNLAGIKLEETIAYQNIDVQNANPEIQKQLRAGKINWVTMTSSAIARSTIRLFGEDLAQAKTVSISPKTSAAMIELGVSPDAEAAEYNMNGIVEAIQSFKL